MLWIQGAILRAKGKRNLIKDCMGETFISVIAKRKFSLLYFSLNNFPFWKVNIFISANWV